LRSLILMPEGTPKNYVEATRGYGAEVSSRQARRPHSARSRSSKRTDGHSIHPFDDPLVMAGQGTVGLEILEDVRKSPTS